MKMHPTEEALFFRQDPYSRREAGAGQPSETGGGQPTNANEGGRFSSWQEAGYQGSEHS